MKALINKSDIVTAIETLKQTGKKPTIANIHAALGSRGSLSTIVKLKAEIEADAVAAGDSEEGLKAFREVWALATAEGRAQKDAESLELRAALDAITADNERLDADAVAAGARLDEVQAQRDNLVDQLSQANQALSDARATIDAQAAKLASALAEISRMQSERMEAMTREMDATNKAIREKHETQIELARAGEQIAGLTRDRARLKNDAKNLRDELSSIEALLKDEQRTGRELERQNQKLEEAALDRDRLTSDLEAAKAKIASLTKKRQNAKS